MVRVIPCEPFRFPVYLSRLLTTCSSRLVHCHIAWHASEGLSLEFVENQSEISSLSVQDPDATTLADTCTSWQSYTAGGVDNNFFGQDDSGI